MQGIIEGTIDDARDGGLRTTGQSIEQLSHFPIAVGSALIGLLVPGKRVVGMQVKPAVSNSSILILLRQVQWCVPAVLPAKS